MKKLSFTNLIKRLTSGFLVFAMLLSLNSFNLTVWANNDTVAENVVGNSSFESNFKSEISDWKFSTTENWEYKNATIVSDEKYEGSQSALIGNGSSKGYIGQRVTLNLETTYVLEAYVKGGGLNLRIGKGSVTYPNDDKNILAQTTTVSSDDWQKVSLEYTTYARWGSYTAYDFVVVIQDINNTDKVYIDNISLTEKQTEIDYENEQLINFGSSYKYTINSSNVIPDYPELGENEVLTNGKLDIDNSWFGNQLTIGRSNSSGTLIKTQMLTIPEHPSAPVKENFTVTQPVAGNDTGKIEGISSDMEYSTDNGNTWTAGDDEALSGIAGGTVYLVRYKATDSSFKSESYSISIDELPSETATPAPNKDNYSAGVLEIGDSVNFDFGENTTDGYIGVDASKGYFEGPDSVNGLTYGFLGLGKDGYSKVSEKYDSFQMVKDEQITLKNGGENDASIASKDNVYAYQSIFPEGSDLANGYNMGEGVVPIRFALKSERHSYYHVKITVSGADPQKSAIINVFNEKRHPIATNVELAAGAVYTAEFTANVMDVYYKNDKAIYADDMLNIVVTGENAGLAAAEITRLGSCRCGRAQNNMGMF
jgi:hypothetical protein